MNSNLTKIKNCSHKIIQEKLTIKSRAYFYCYKCGKLIIVKDLKIYETLNKGKFEFNPIKMINQMILKQKKEIKIIKDKFNNNNNMNIMIQNNIYIKNRDIFIFYLKQFCNKMNYSQRVFYHSLYLLDSYLIHILKKDVSKRTIILITLGFFLISSKFIEIDIFEPNINQFCKIEKDIIISQKEILNMEIKCLQLINYNILNYSTYDWLEILNKVGVIFNTQAIINFKIEQIYEKQKYLLKRIINYDLLYKYNSFQIALSIIHITLDNYFSTNKINKDLFELFLSIFNYKYSYYEKCYNDIKNHIFNYKKNNNDSKDDCKQIENYNKTEYNKNNLYNYYNQSVENILKHPIKFSNKLNSKNIKINEFLLKNKIRSEKIINMLKNKNKTESEEKNNIKCFKNSNEINSLILPKDKILFKKERQHLTIDCNNSSYNNNFERIKNNKLNYNNLINYLLNKTKKNNNSFQDLFNKRKFLINKNSSRNMVYSNNEINKNSAGNIFNINNNNDLKKSLSSISNNTPFKKKEQIIKNSAFLFNFDNFNNKNSLKKLNISSNKNILEKNKSLKTLYNKNQIKSYILKNDSFFSSSNDLKNDKNIILRNNNNFFNTNNKKGIIINKEIIPSLKNEILDVTNFQF